MDIITAITSYTIFSNTIFQYILFIFFICLSPFIAKIINKIIDIYVKKYAEKTSFKFDDIIVKSLHPSISLFIFAGMFYVASLQINQGIYSEIFDRIFNFLIIVPLVFFMIKFSTEFIAHYLKGSQSAKKAKLNEAAIDLLMQIIRIALFFIGILLVLANLGYDVSTLIAGLGVGGLAFALAAQDLLKNFFAGIALIFDKTFNKGERVQFQGHSGIIEELKLRSTKLRTYDGTLLTIPNSQLSDNIVENVTKVPRVKVVMTIGLVYGTTSKKIKEAKQIIQKAVDDQIDADGESTTIYFDNFGAYSLDIMVYYYAKELTMKDWKKRTQMKEEINISILEGFEKAKIEMAFPTQTIELKK